jgi:hypothetical protein
LGTFSQILYLKLPNSYCWSKKGNFIMEKFKKFGSIFTSNAIIFLVNFLLLAGCSDDNTTVQPAPQKPELVISPQPLYFGHIPAGHSASRELIIRNNGGAALNISNLTIEGNNAALFSLLDSTGPIEVGPFSGNIMGVKFTPNSGGDFSAHITIISNNASSPDQANLTGNGSIISGGLITFERILGGLDRDNAGSVRLTDDGGYIVAGSTTDPAEDWSIASLIKLDQYGNPLWSKTYAYAGPSSFSGVAIANDGDFVAVGSSRTFETSKQNIYVVRTDPTGEIIRWQGEYSFGGQDDNANTIEATSEGGYIIAGDTKNTTSQLDKDALLLKINSSGDEEWHQTYGSDEGEIARSVKQTGDNGFVFVGSTTVPPKEGVPDFGVYMVKTDADGNQQWSKIIDGPGSESARSVIVTSDDGYALAGYTMSEGAGQEDVYVIKTNSSGDTLWTQTYGGTADDGASAIISTEDQGYLIVGSTESFGAGQNDVYIVKTDDSGKKSWHRYYGGVNGDGASSVREVLGFGYIICGTARSFSKDNDVYVLKVNSQGMIE